MIGLYISHNPITTKMVFFCPEHIYYIHFKKTRENAHCELTYVQVVTVAYTIDPQCGTLKYGGTLYKKEKKTDNWSRKMNNAHARERLERKPVTIIFSPFNPTGLVMDDKAIALFLRRATIWVGLTNKNWITRAANSCKPLAKELREAQYFSKDHFMFKEPYIADQQEQRSSDQQDQLLQCSTDLQEQFLQFAAEIDRDTTCMWMGLLVIFLMQLARFALEYHDARKMVEVEVEVENAPCIYRMPM